VNILLFDKNHNFLDAAWQQIDGGEQIGATPKAAHDYMMQEVTVKEAGFAYAYVSNENPTLVEFYADDVTVTHTPTNLIQYNEYYPFGLQTANSWTRENTTGNQFLANGGTELNPTTSLYDLAFRNYDPVLGRMNGVDPMATKYASLTPYNYSFNDPVTFTDVTGAEPYTINYSATTSQYYTMYTYDDRVDERNGQEFTCSMCWRTGESLAFYQAATGYGSSMFGMGDGWSPGQNSVINQNKEAMIFGPSVYAPWDDAYYPALDVLLWDPTHQRASYRNAAYQSASNWMASFDRQRLSKSEFLPIAQQQTQGNGPGSQSDFIYDNNNAIGLGIGIVEPGFGAAWDAVRAAPGAYTNSAKIISKAGGIGLVGLNVALTGYTLYNEKQNGTFNTHSIVNGAVTVVGVGLTITGLVISAPVVAIIGAGVGIGYGIAQVSGIDGWIDSNWGFNNKTPK